LHVVIIAACGGTAGVAAAQIVPHTLKPTPSLRVTRPVMTTVPAKPWISRNATFVWDKRGAPASRCSLDRRRWKDCVSPRAYRNLALGTHVFRVRGVDGSRRSSVNRFTWTIARGLPPARPVLDETPEANTISTDAIFVFDVPAGMKHECTLDSSGWQRCSNPAVYAGLGVGAHTFCVRSVSAAGIPSTPSCKSWFIHSPVDPSGTPTPTPPVSAALGITGDLPTTLAPGVGGTVAVRITNPFSIPLTVTALTITVVPGSSNLGCDGSSNLRVEQSNLAGGAVSVVVLAGGSVVLPAQGATAPRVTMRDLPSNQDACKGASFAVSYAAAGSG